MTDGERIKNWAREIGFDKIGLALAGPTPGGEHLTEWLTRGCHGGMNWMKKNADRRLDPRRVLPEARSIISVALNYYIPHERQPGELKISRYAWGTDYHYVLGRMLEELVACIANGWPASANLWYVDAGPVLEKAWAEQAGIGWIGKNGVLISRDFGTWLFLGEIITTLQLKPDLPQSNHCGTCTSCIDACPAGAIVEPYVVDAHRCISFWTIEHRGEFPPGIADKLDGWVFGCDACQDVCPFNRFQKNAKLREDFAPRRELLRPGRWLEISENNFADLTRKSPLQRTRLEGIKRNLQAAGIMAVTASRPVRQKKLKK